MGKIDKTNDVRGIKVGKYIVNLSVNDIGRLHVEIQKDDSHITGAYLDVLVPKDLDADEVICG